MVFTLGLAAICWSTWKTRNKACIDKRTLKDPYDIARISGMFLHEILDRVCIQKSRHK